MQGGPPSRKENKRPKGIRHQGSGSEWKVGWTRGRKGMVSGGSVPEVMEVWLRLICYTSVTTNDKQHHIYGAFAIQQWAKHWIFTINLWYSYWYSPHVTDVERKHRKVKEPSQGHRATTRQWLDSNQAVWILPAWTLLPLTWAEVIIYQLVCENAKCWFVLLLHNLD